jgi:GT2 family glycosyltransferase
MPDNSPAGGIAVVVVSYNSSRYLEDCLRSLRAQTVAPRRVLIVDNASRDGSADICRRFPGMELIEAGGNLGFAAGNNLGVARADDCEWIALLNPDAFAAPDWIEQLTAAARRHPDVNVFACRLVSAGNPSLLDGAGDAYASSGAAWPRFQGHRVGSEGGTAHEVFGACGAAVMYRRAAYLAAGGFDESFFCYYEDVDLAFRMQLMGNRCIYLPEAAAEHVGSGITGFSSDFTIYHAHRNVVWTFFKNMPGGYFWLYLPRHLLLNLGSILAFARRGRLAVILRAKWHALRGLPRVLAARRAIQRARRVTPAQAVRHVQRNGMLGSLLRRLTRRAAAPSS